MMASGRTAVGVEEGQREGGGWQAVEPLWGVRKGREYGWGCKGGDGRGDLGPEAVAPLCVWGMGCGMWGVVCYV